MMIEEYSRLRKEMEKHKKNNQVHLRFLPDLYEDVKNATSFLDEKDTEITSSERMFCIRNNIYEIPKCPTCKGHNKYSTKTTKYLKYCSPKCSNSCPDKVKRGEQTSLRNYGVRNPMMDKEIQRKSNSRRDHMQAARTAKKTFMDKYGVSHPMKVEEVKEKSKRTSMERYGVEYPMQNREISSRVAKTHSLQFFETSIMNDRILEYVQPLFTADEYTGYNDKEMYPYRCNFCSLEFEAWIDSSYRRFPRCPDCFPMKKSQGEQELSLFIRSILPDGVEIVENDRTILNNNFELDLYIPSKSIAIEYNGLFWHSEEQGKNSGYHLRKQEECESKGIFLIQIFEDEFIYKKDIVKSRLKHLLGVNDSQRVYARKCYVEEINSDDKRDFLNKNHIQGNDSSQLNLGLWYPLNDSEHILLSVLTVNKPRISLGHKGNGYDLELSRYATDMDYHVIGGFGKLFKYLEGHYEWNSIITYADLRWSQGNLYIQNGFDLSHRSRPNYWYFRRTHNKGKRFHRYQFRKQVLRKKFPEVYSDDKTEYEIMREAKYERLWDCGNLVFVYNSKYSE